MIGTIVEVKNAPGGTFLNVKVKLSSNFTNLRSVYITKNKQFNEIQQLEQQTIGN
jgi:cell shape-determining protein MreC